MFSIKSVFLIILLICASSQQNKTIDVIGFPESDGNLDLKNEDNRPVVFIPAMCPANELFYPGDQKDDWICDCRPSFLYHPTSDGCWPAYQRGPCTEGQYLVLKQDTAIPVCDKNPCVVDGFVSWNGNCEKLGATGPCNFKYSVPAVLGVNATTLVVSCVRITLPNRLSEHLTAPNECPPGCKRSINGKCGSSTQ